ncbi:hypothetical protein [Pseudoalteromonas atlantica]
MFYSDFGLFESDFEVAVLSVFKSLVPEQFQTGTEQSGIAAL